MHVDSTPTVKYTINTRQNANSQVEEMVLPQLEMVLPQLQVSHCYVSMQIYTESRLNLPFSNWNTMMEDTRGDTGQYSKVSRETARSMVTWCASRAVCTPALRGKNKLFDHEETRQQLKEASMTQANITKKMGCSYIIMESTLKIAH